MKQAVFLISLSVFFSFSCKNKDKDVKPDTTQEDTIHVDEVKENAEEYIHVFDDFKGILNEEAKKYSLNFEEYTPKNNKDDKSLMEDSYYVSYQKMFLTDNQNPARHIAVLALVYREERLAVQYIDDRCEEYRQEVQSGEVSKIDSRIFRKDFIVYQVISVNNSIEHIVASAFEKLTEKYKINEMDIYPCNREYMSAEQIEQIKPAIGKWLDYYKLNINDFIYDGEKSLELEQLRKDTTNPYYGEFSDEDDVYDPILNDYSPDRTKYVDLMSSLNVYLEKNGNYYFGGSDDSHQLKLLDRKNRSFVMFSFRGLSNFADAVFWIDNDTFAVTGYNSVFEVGYYYVEIYDLKKDTCTYYLLRKECNYKNGPYGMYNMKSRGIIID